MIVCGPYQNTLPNRTPIFITQPDYNTYSNYCKRVARIRKIRRSYPPKGWRGYVDDSDRYHTLQPESFISPMKRLINKKGSSTVCEHRKAFYER